MAGMHDPLGQQADRALVRDAALLRISRTRRWMLAGAAALSAGLAALASALLPGKSFGAHSSSHTAASARPSSSSITPPLPAAANADQLGLQPSGQAPESAPAPAAPQPEAPAPQAAAPAPAPAGGGGAVVSGGS